jgi:beta-lactamase class D
VKLRRFSSIMLLVVLSWPALSEATPSGVTLSTNEPAWQDHPEWQAEFGKRGVAGTMLVFDEAANRYHVFDRKRAQTGYLPASTFKVFNALVALETGAVKDEYEVIRWDGVERSVGDWNRDHSLASAMKFSVVWFYQEVARRAGAERMQDWISRVGYGNRDIGGGIDQFWLKGKLRISALEQIGFLRRLAAGSLPFGARAHEAVRRISIIEAAPTYVLHGKTGWVGTSDPKSLGWIVGWVDRNGKRWCYALNIDMLHGGGDAAKRLEIARAILTQLGALPAL